MNEKSKEIINNAETKKDKIFEVLNKKRKPDNSLKDLNQNSKKKMFILYKPIIELNKKQNYFKKNLNENFINNLNLINRNNKAKNINLLTIKKESKNSVNINSDKKSEKSLILENKNNNNKINNNNYNLNNKVNNINTIKNIDKTESTKNENQKQAEYGDYICFKENQIGSGSFGEVLYGKHKFKPLEVAVKIINSETSSETIKKEINFSRQLQNEIGFPIIYYTGAYDKKNIIVESL